MSDFDDLISDDLDAVDVIVPERTYTEICKKCGGKGYLVYGYVNIRKYECYACKGKGKFERKTSPETRAKAKVRNEVRKETQKQTLWAEFAEKHGEIAQWIEASQDFNFAVSLKESVQKFGFLTAAQLAAAQKCADKRKAALVAAQERTANAPVLDTTALEEVFNRDADKKIKLRFEHLSISKAPATGRNAGALYVKARDDYGTYLGKIQGGKFFASRECKPEHTAEILEVSQDPKAAAIAYGKRTGVCCVCGRELTDPASIEAGIGPICEGKF